MDQAVDTPEPAAADPSGEDAADDATPDATPDVTDGTAEDAAAGARGRLRPDWWHRDHPIFVPLAGFYTGMVYVIVVPGLYGALLKGLFGYERARELFPFVLLTLVVPIGLTVPRRTRKFGRYMLFGVLATAIVAIGVAVLVFVILLSRDG